VRVFLDTSVLLAAAGSASGASRHLLLNAQKHGLALLSSPYCVAETNQNIAKLGHLAAGHWSTIVLPGLSIVQDCTTLDRPLVFNVAKDRPVVITALAAQCPWLLTLDRDDFGAYFDHGIYGMQVGTPGTFLMRLRDKKA
jgi:predicted nucleic acid-binding protein